MLGPGDVAFVGDTAYAMVTLVADDLGGSDTVGIYRVDGPSSFTGIADIGQWSRDNPPARSDHRAEEPTSLCEGDRT
jgi:hypothetical protein